MKHIFILIAFLFSSAAAFAQYLPSAVYVRPSIGYKNTLGLGVGYTNIKNFSVGAEVIGWSDLCGIVGGVDARYYVTYSVVRPFVDLFVGYGQLGMTYQYQSYYDFAYRAMLGINWRGFDLGGGVTYDSFYHLAPVATLSYTIPFVYSWKR